VGRAPLLPFDVVNLVIYAAKNDVDKENKIEKPESNQNGGRREIGCFSSPQYRFIMLAQPKLL